MANRRRMYYSAFRNTDYFHSLDEKHKQTDETDNPPNSRLFIVCGKTTTEDDFREAFQKYGTIEEIRVVQDKTVGGPKGVTYIKFSKTSEAAHAREEMNGRCIGSHPRPLKILIAHSRNQGSKREKNEEERLVRLFVVVPKTMSEPDVREYFSQFGDLDSVSVVRDKNTKESKGFAYVKYHSVSHAAKAFEGCDRSYKPIFAEPKPTKPHTDTMEGFNVPGSATSTSTYDNTFVPCKDTSFPNPEGFTRLNVIASPILNQNQLWQLFDIVPGLDLCHLRHDPISRQFKGQVTVVYNCPQAAAYAKKKLHGFEYPPGHRLIVNADSSQPHKDMPTSHSRPVHSSLSHPSILPSSSLNPVPYPGSTSPHLPPNQAPARSGNLPPNQAPARSGNLPPNQAPARFGNLPPNQAPAGFGNLQTDLVALTKTIAHATSLIQAAGLSKGGNSVVPQKASNNAGEMYDRSYCSVKLPGTQPLAPFDSPVAERLFIVCHPLPPPIYVLKDVFGRFGNLIDINMLWERNYGYVKYATKEAAEQATATLHHQEICGARFKVLAADPYEEPDWGTKRPYEKPDCGTKKLKVDDQKTFDNADNLQDNV